MHLLICKLLLTTALTAGPAFPLPLAIGFDDAMKFSTGTLASVDPRAATAVVTTQAGPLTVILTGGKLLASNGRPLALIDLRPGQRVNVYFHISDGAVVDELDVTAPLPNS